MKLVTYIALCTPFMICAAQEPVANSFLLAGAPRSLEHYKKFPCSVVGCLKRYGEKKHLKFHLKKVHDIDELDPNTNERPYTCFINNCSKDFETKFGLEKHQLRKHDYVEDENYPAPVQALGIAGVALDDQHTLRSTEELTVQSTHPYVCRIDGCDRAFQRKDRLKSHQDKHFTTKVPNFFCPIPHCGKAFTRSYLLQVHKAREHDQLKYRTLSSTRELRPKSTQSDATQITPQEAPEDSKKFPCSVVGCLRGYNARQNLKIHLKKAHDIDELDPTNVESKPFVCHINNCCSDYGDRVKLERHQLRDHGYIEVKIPKTSAQKKFSCTMCEKSFTRMQTLRAHIKKSHPDSTAFKPKNTQSEVTHITAQEPVEKPQAQPFNTDLVLSHDVDFLWQHDEQTGTHATHANDPLEGDVAAAQSYEEAEEYTDPLQSCVMAGVAFINHELENQPLSSVDDVPPQSPQFTTGGSLYDIFRGMNHRSTTLNEGNL